MAYQNLARTLRPFLDWPRAPMVANSRLKGLASFSSEAESACNTHDGHCLGAADYATYLSSAASRRKPSAIRALMPLLKVPGMISLGGGMPNPDTFPFKKLTVEVVSGEEFTLEGAQLKEALQYSPTLGLPSLLKHLDALRQAHHAPVKLSSAASEGVEADEERQNDSTRCASMVSTGSQDSLSKAFEMLLNPGDHLLVEAPTYSGSLAFLRPMGVQLEGIATDAGGLIPDSLDDILDNWEATRPGIPKPRVLYTIPNGSNPTGGSLSTQRRLHIYATARKHHLLILEDDPYYYLQFAPRENWSPSFLSLDEDGRVLRFDSFSKVLSAGLRLGWATGPNFLVDRLQLHMQATSLHASGLSQGLVAGLLDTWADSSLSSSKSSASSPQREEETGGSSRRGAGGLAPAWAAHVASVAQSYLEKRDCFLAACATHLGGPGGSSSSSSKSGNCGNSSNEKLATWSVPAAGMFCWLDLSASGVTDSAPFVKDVLARDAKVLLVPGNEFMPDASLPTPFVRASFSTASASDVDEALRRLASALRNHKAK